MMTRARFLLLGISFLLGFCASANGGTLEKMKYAGRDAYRLSDGTVEAIVVPELSGRVMSFGEIGGPNWLWNAPANLLGGIYKNYGGDKTFVGPHAAWKTFAAELWPPDPTWDGGAHQAMELPDGKLQTTGGAWRGFGVRVIREFGFEHGEFVLSQTLEKLSGEPRLLCVWPVTQLSRPDAVYLPLNPRSAYTHRYQLFGDLPREPKFELLDPSMGRPTLLRVSPEAGLVYKVGADCSIAAILATTGAKAFLQRASISAEEYPDGAPGAGFPVECYNSGGTNPAGYVEIELLSPLRVLATGDRCTHIVRWSLHALPAAPDARVRAIQGLVMGVDEMTVSGHR